MIKKTKSKKQIIDEAKNLLTSLLEKQRKNNNNESLQENTTVWIKFCLLHQFRTQSYTRFVELCEANELITKKASAWKVFVYSVYAFFRIPQIVEWLQLKLNERDAR